MARATDKLTDALVRKLEVPARGAKITYDGEVKGFGVRVTANGAKSFVLNYRTRAGRERRLTIGSWPDWSVGAARDEAKRHKRAIDQGGDPLEEIEAERTAPTMADLAQRYREDHLPRKRSARDDVSMIERDVLPALGRIKVANVRHADVEKLHRDVSKRAPYRANRVVSLLSRMFNLSIRWGWRADNPARGIERNHEDRPQRFLSPAEIARLAAVLDGHPERTSAALVRFLLLSGCRFGEAAGATWDQFDLEAGVWVKPSAHTKAKREHRVPLSAPARQLLAELRAANGDHPHVFPGKDGRPLTTVKTFWASVCRAANIQGARIHDLRHTHASILASAGLSLPIIGALLGHTHVSTTARYAHLLDDPLREAAERVGAVVAGGKPPADVVTLRRRSSS
jgi:integrase